ncbi:hypothetical protein GOP47_0005485 [Adiantum capillus-veneris]|uniref:Ribosomal protein L14 n=1 Tax=Adiantum capillus-veneris TaxID=13818 RepID=A0A9D4ZNL5_ADICA|nr:hypothetical protein GOP47_0005485 [Adiantum capillus-veneris]
MSGHGELRPHAFLAIKRVAMVNYGPSYENLVVIIDVVDQNRALVDTPNMVPGAMNFKRLSLIDLVVEIPRMPKKK